MSFSNDVSRTEVTVDVSWANLSTVTQRSAFSLKFIQENDLENIQVAINFQNSTSIQGLEQT